MPGLPTEREGALYYRELPDGRDVSVYPLFFGQAQVALSRLGDDIHQSYYYLTVSAGLAAAAEWNGEGDAPVGWWRHPNTGRRRKDGDPSQEYIQW